jgi:hypothetical protein
LGWYDHNGHTHLGYLADARNEPALDEIPHVRWLSPDGPAWGYDGNGPADAALSILVHATNDAEFARDHAREFTSHVIAHLPKADDFTLPVHTVTAFIDQHRLGPDAGRDLARREEHVIRREADLGRRDRSFVLRAAGLERREHELATREATLIEREQRVAQAEQRLDARAAAIEHAVQVEPAWSVPADPIREQIRALMLHTHDPLPVVAKGLGLDADYAAAIVDGSTRSIDLAHVQQLCEAMHATPYDIWGTEVGRSIAHAYGPELWPRFIEPLQPLEPPPTPPGPELEL